MLCAQRLHNRGADAFDFSLDDKTPIQNRHPILFTNKDKLSLGHLTDVHVNSRQFAFRQSQAQVLQTPSGEEPVSEILGDQVNVTFNTLKNLMDQIGHSDADMLVLTGDLVDFNRNLDPTTVEDWPKKLRTPGALWELLHQSYHTQEKHYVRFIDDLIVTSLLLYFCTTYKKPVFITSGNHEMYSLPYGLSPRVLWVRANQGIPADHNLTIQEALLIYGPDYGHVVKLGRYNKENVEWLDRVFNPTTDYVMAYQEQRFIGLAWGDSESIASAAVRGGGVLPRADESLSDAQYELLQQGVTDGAQRVLFSHFTLASYAADQALAAEGEINCNNSLQKPGKFDQGSFVEKRLELYGHVHRQDLHYTLSGHSHRAGLYEPLRFDHAWGRASMTVKGNEIPEAKSPLPFQGATAVITSGSGGPIACQNHYEKNVGSLGDCGLDWPSGTILTLDGEPSIQRIIPKGVQGAKPRFCVALDYFDLINERVFLRFESGVDEKKTESEFLLELNAKLPGQRFIRNLTLFVYMSDQWTSYAFAGVQGEGRVLRASMQAQWQDFKKEVIERAPTNPPIVFLSISFNTDLDKKTGYSQYNFGSPWLMRVEIKSRTKLQGYGEGMVEVSVGGYTIARHAVYGEKPDFYWYMDEFPDLYPYARMNKRNKKDS